MFIRMELSDRSWGRILFLSLFQTLVCLGGLTCYGQSSATQIAQKIGQEIIAIAVNGGINNAGEKLGVKNLAGLLRQAEDLLR